MIKKILKFVKHPKFILFKLDQKKIVHISDELYIKLLFEYIMGEPLNLNNPKTFNEKLQWIKFNDRKEIYTMMVDKYEVKKYVADLIGSEYVIPTLGVYDSFDDIDFEKLPGQFVIKTTHDSGSVVVCKDKQQFNIENARKIINKSLKNNFYNLGREWPYKNVKPRIIIEKFIEDSSHKLYDYKFQCFHGKMDNVFVCVDRGSESGVKYHYFDRNWNYLPYCPYPGIDASNVNIEKPSNLDDMIKIVEMLSKDLLQVRVDLYNVDNHIYFGEFTFFSNGGFDTDITKKADKILGAKLILPIEKNKE